MRRNNLRLIQFITNMVVFIRKDRIDSKDISKKETGEQLTYCHSPVNLMIKYSFTWFPQRAERSQAHFSYWPAYARILPWNPR